MFFIVSFHIASAQDKLYANEFPLGDVQLLNGPFMHAIRADYFGRNSIGILTTRHPNDSSPPSGSPALARHLARQEQRHEQDH